ncbi:MAG TPA: PEP-CTERM sorting domain-containing protein [Anaerohalosphaeraceae bacterium]|nr:PEP-CTERM sorting domain-containing protein [Anaerohalosphaeraceae bacterium]HRV19502.1 PEP-CTERM sorting domain-containing protein [Anaerohalosphaeraceae bacterium]
MKRLGILLLLGMIGAAQAVLIDDFSGDLSAYTSTVILDANGGGANTAAWQISGGTLQLNTTVYDGIEQYAMIYSGLTLGIGQELQADVVIGATGSQDIGLYVGGTTPTTGVRRDYIAMYRRSSGQLFSRGFDGTTEYTLAGNWTNNIPITALFIARIAENTYEAGWYDGATRNVLVTRTPAYANDADVIGFYADVRGVGIVGSLDNLRIVPEPATLTLLGLGTGLLARKRKYANL